MVEQVDQLTALLERLRKDDSLSERIEAAAALVSLSEKLAEKDARIAVLEGALRGLVGWGVHDEGCDLDPEYGKWGRRVKCTCGLAEAEKSARTALEASHE